MMFFSDSQQVSLKKLSRRGVISIVLILLVCLVCILLFSHSLINLANQDAVRNQQVMTKTLQSFSNLERFIVLGDRLLQSQSSQERIHSAVQMQALLYHPSMQAVFDTHPDFKMDGSYRKTSRLLAQFISPSDVGGDISFSQSAQLEQARVEWYALRDKLGALSNETSVNLLQLVNQSSSKVAVYTHRMLGASIAAVLIGILAILLFYLVVRSTLYKPLMAISDYFTSLSQNSETSLRLGRANSAEMQQTFDAIHHLLEARKSLDYLSYYDPLTGLLNRKSFIHSLSCLIESCAPKGHRFAVLYLDLDNFKSINDAMGHAIGDQFLQRVTRRFPNVLSETDIQARVGGDEFAIIIPNITSLSDAKNNADGLIKEISRASTLGELDLYISGSVGISIYPEDGEESEALLRNAEIAMYHGKSVSRGCSYFFNEKMNEQVSQRIKLESELIKAIKEQEFELFYQPQVSEDGRSIHGVEALIRWRKCNGSLVLPGGFIPLAEESGQIIDIGNWVIGKACETVSHWCDRGINVRMSINLSAKQLFDNQVVEVVKSALQYYHVDPASLELEITESAAMQSPEMTATCLSELKKLGVRLAIDDFGTGYSSLAYLKMFPIDRLKLDRAFVKDLPSNNNDQAIFNMTKGLAGSLSLEMIAEGVETAEQYEYLSTHGCPMYQGFYFSQPLSAADFETFYFSCSEEMAVNQC